MAARGPRGVPDDGAERLMSIGSLAKACRVSTRTIRYYEELGILPTPPRTDGGTRKYPPEFRFYIEGALALRELGFSLEEIKLLGKLALGRKLTATQRKNAAKVVHEKTSALEHKIRVLERLRDLLHDHEGGWQATSGGEHPLVPILRDARAATAPAGVKAVAGS